MEISALSVLNMAEFQLGYCASLHTVYMKEAEFKHHSSTAFISSDLISERFEIQIKISDAIQVQLMVNSAKS